MNERGRACLNGSSVSLRSCITLWNRLQVPQTLIPRLYFGSNRAESSPETGTERTFEKGKKVVPSLCRRFLALFGLSA